MISQKNVLRKAMAVPFFYEQKSSNVASKVVNKKHRYSLCHV